MRNVLLLNLFTVVLLFGMSALAQPAPSLPAGVQLPVVEGGFPPFQKIEGVPEFREQTLKLIDIPKPSGPPIVVFNGKDLSEFTPWLGYSNGTMFPSNANDKPLGETGVGDVFKVVQDEGKPAIYISGRIWGAITTKRDLGNYHLSLQYKYGKQWNPNVRPNSGVLYHSYGAYGAFSGTWMSAIEYETEHTLAGMMIPIGRGINVLAELGKGKGPGLFGNDDFRFMSGGKAAEVRLPTPVKESRDVERPLGEWNKVDLYVAGDKAVQVLNGVPTVAISNIRRKGPDGVDHPLTHGRIQLESEGTEVWMRDIVVEPITDVPKVVVDSAR